MELCIFYGLITHRNYHDETDTDISNYNTVLPLEFTDHALILATHALRGNV